MTAETPRLRMFAGPNGSGKSTIKSVLRPELIGLYINPDEIELEAKSRHCFDLARFGVTTSIEEVARFFGDSALLLKVGIAKVAQRIRLADGRLHFDDVSVNAYVASVVADFLRQKLLEQRATFTFETVMSSPDKVRLLESARAQGYRTYLYYIATDDPAINVFRVNSRVLFGGHTVPEDKIVSRYDRSLSLLFDAIRHCSRSYIFDNSGQLPVWIAEFTDGKLAGLKTKRLPEWFKKAVLVKLPPGSGND